MPDLKTVHLTLPAATSDLRALEIGSVAYLTGRVFTGREGVYKRAVEDGFGMPAGTGRARQRQFPLLARRRDQSRRHL